MLRSVLLTVCALSAWCFIELPAAEVPGHPAVRNGHWRGRGLDPDALLWTPPDDATHIDPGNAADPEADGSRAHPFPSLSHVEWRDGLVVALRRGRTLEAEACRINGTDITLASYGSGPRPVLLCTSAARPGANRHAIRIDSGRRIVIRDLEIKAPRATSCLRLGGQHSRDIRVINCRCHGAGWGIRAFGLSGLTVLNSEIDHILDDGMFIAGVTDIVIGHCYIHDVNRNWKPPYTPQSEAGGDAIQLADCNRWHVHHSILDRTNSGNKFCFIANGATQNEGTFEHNLTLGPLTSGDGGSAIYFHDGTGLVVRHNMVVGPAPSALYSHARDLRIYGNVFAHTSGGIFTSASSVVYHNVFYGQKSPVISGGNITAANNLFVLDASAQTPFGRVHTLRQDHNLFMSRPSATDESAGTPGWVDPDRLVFQLEASSPCIDAGRNVGVTEDMRGTPIPQGRAPDVGAFEYNAE